MKFISLLLPSFVFMFALQASAAFEVPPLTSPVIDDANILRPGDEKILREWFQTVNAKGKAQLQILTVQNLGGLTVEQASMEVVEDWQLGDKAKDNGLLILVSLDERKIRIEVGQGLEGDIPDALASRIIREAMTPLFKQGNPSQGVVLGAYQVIRLVQPDFDPDVQLQGAVERENIFSKYEGIFIFIFVIFVLMVRGILSGGRRSHRGLGGGAYYGGWGSGGGFGGGSSGGGWSGGGGGFSGGGASGGW